MAKTFSLEDSLPNLTVPSLESTIEKYLYSVRAIADDEEYLRTQNICKNFLDNEGPVLQAKLKEREKIHRNWVEDLWLDQGYLELRIPQLYINFAGISSYTKQFWPPLEGSQVERMSLSLHILGKFWKMLREQKVAPHTNSKGKPFSMKQLRTVFNTCRIPHRKKDELISHFQPVSEGDCPSHSIVICQGRFFKINLISCRTDEPYTPPQFAKVLEDILDQCKSGAGDGVAALTGLDRDSWADYRSHLVEISPDNEQNLRYIESAIHAVSMEDVSPMNYTEMMFNALTGNPVQRWRDKSYQTAWSSNGTFMSNCEHSAVDGMVLVLFVQFNTMFLMQCGGKWNGSTDTDDISDIEELNFSIDNKIREGIVKGKETVKSFTDNTDLVCPIYDKFGKVELKQFKIFPDAFFQICLQLTYMRLHGKPAPTYETATTRQFYHGRTETCRTCTPELVEFCKAFIDGRPRPELQHLLKYAHEKFTKLMFDCQDNKGCDRHLFGLSLTAANEGMAIPEIFTDPMYAKTGGNGNFVLSTSFVGFFNSTGSVVPMLDDGYGVFYRIIDHQMVYSMTSWKHSKVTDLLKFNSCLEDTFGQVYHLFKEAQKPCL
ncbi:peroxisomal carnitine O-octanoyltransferase-like isoform X2 [Clavelina lepadiformis]|uniref:Choline/carnitine acyltransferase domain-containing protein n=1 Tax=Clavelina lepadiformis TaxID=159417 RepID=A0ABP0FSE2_CLALP